MKSVIEMAEECGIPEFVDNESQAENIIRFAKLIVQDVVAMFEKEHVWVKERHNYWLCAANMIKDEFLEENNT